MRVELQYGDGDLIVTLPDRQVTLLVPQAAPGLQDPADAFRQAVRQPVQSPPLREVVDPSDRVTIVIPDITRPLPSHTLLPWILEEIPDVSPDRITVLIGPGSHRPSTPREIESLVGTEIVRKCRVVDHDSRDPANLLKAGADPRGNTVLLNRHYVEADRRILLGFIEPHFMAGFSGGYKGIFPAIADLDSIMRYHDSGTVGNPLSTWGRLEGNPTQATIRHNGSLLPLDFLINVTLNRRKQITRFFCGDPMKAHEAGCEYARRNAMVECPHTYPIVITTNSGYPLDQNLYQSVKGMCAAAMIVDRGGLILCAAECRDGFPEHGNFKRMLFDHTSPTALLEKINSPGFSLFDQWEAQKLAIVCEQARVGLYSSLPPEETRRAYLEPVPDLEDRLEQELERVGRDAPIAVLPEGPQTIPYVRD